MGAGAEREGKRRALPQQRSAEGSERRSAQGIVQDVAARLEALTDPGSPAAAAFSPGSPPSETAGDDPTQGLRDIERDLREADAMLDGLAREIRIALTVIKGRAQLLRRQAFATGAPDRRLVRSVEEIDRSVVQIDRLLHDRLLAPPAGDVAADS